MVLSLESGAAAPQASTYNRYSSGVEQPAADEHVIFDELSRTMQHITRTMASRYRHAFHPVHAKSNGLLVGTLEICGRV